MFLAVQKSLLVISNCLCHLHGDSFQDGGCVAIHEANLNLESKPICSIIIAKLMIISKFDFNTNANSVITIV